MPIMRTLTATPKPNVGVDVAAKVAKAAKVVKVAKVVKAAKVVKLTV